MNIKKKVTFFLVFFFISSSLLFIYVDEEDESTEPEPILFETDVSQNENEPSSEEEKTSIEEYVENEVFISFKEDADNVSKKELFDNYNIRIIEADEKNNSYLVTIQEIKDEDQLKEIISEIEKESIVSLIFINNKAQLQQEQNNSFLDTASENFEEASATYNDSVNTFINPKSNYTFLYPSTWTVTEDLEVLDQFGDGKIIFREQEKEEADLKDIAESLLPDSYRIDGDIDTFTRKDGAQISKWVITNGEVLRPQGILNDGDISFYFDGNDSANFSQFALIIDSFTLKQK